VNLRHDGPVCATRCGCNYQGQYTGKFAKNLPYCKSSNENNQAGGNFCSLCGTKTSGCSSGTVVVQLYYQSAVDKTHLAFAKALNATHAAAVAQKKAAAKKKYQGLFKKHLWFRGVNTCPGEWVGGRRLPPRAPLHAAEPLRRGGPRAAHRHEQDRGGRACVGLKCTYTFTQRSM